MSYQILFILCFLCTLLIMKISAKYVHAPNGKLLHYILSTPLIARNKKLILEKKTVSSMHTLLSFIFHSILLTTFYQFYLALFSQYQIGTSAKAYIVSIFIYIFTNFLSEFARVLSLLGSEVPVQMHNRPYIAKSLSEFWGVRWNKWIHAWLSIMSKKIAPRSLYLRLFLAFIFSGLFHELMVNLPFYIYYGESYLGYMMLYFTLQFMLVFIEKKFLRNRYRTLNLLYMWLSIILPLPLFINKPLLTFFGLN